MSVNGRLVASLEPVHTQNPEVPPAAVNDVYDIVDQARRVAAAAIAGGGAGEAAALALLRAHPATPRLEERDGPRRIE